MSASSKRFRFQRFAIDDDRCGMKIGTDAVLMGAWANVDHCKRILDIGTGCGIIAMMLAQRIESTTGQIDAIEPDASAAQQATQNVQSSPWPNRITIFNQSLQEFTVAYASPNYDLCVSNPPFFSNSTPSMASNKRQARHTIDLTREQIFDSANRLLTPTGSLCLILPIDQLNETQAIANQQGFYIKAQTSVRPLPDKKFKRVLLRFNRQPTTCHHDELTIESRRHEFTEQYEALTRNFHLRFASGEH